MGINNKWGSILSELERSIPIQESVLDSRVLVDKFETIDESYRDQNYSYLYLSMWKVALRAGRLEKAKSYAKKSLQYLIILKRLPQIKLLIESLREAGLLKKNTSEYSKQLAVLKGIKSNIAKEDMVYFELMEAHAEYWKEFPEFLKQFILLENDWMIDQWKLCYEFILLNHFDKDIFIQLLEKSVELKNEKYEKKFVELFDRMNIQRRKTIPFKAKNNLIHDREKSYVDYDLLSFNILSGETQPTAEEQKRVLNSLKFISPEELREKGHDMIIAFELLGMEQVVLYLCEQVVKIQKEIKQIASTYFVWAQALNSNGDYMKAIDLVDDVLQGQPFNDEERAALVYLKAEAYFKLKKMQQAKKCYLEIKKNYPHYRLVNERLRAIETT
jgi:tetratricopeptide (TPR) repeat protein